MEILHEGNHIGEFLLSEGEGQISREQIEVAPTPVALQSGQVLAVDADGFYVPFDVEAAEEHPAVAVLYSAVGVSDMPQPASIVARLAEVAQARLTGFVPEAAASLLEKTIVVR